MSDLRQRVPGHSLIDELLRQWDLGTIHLDGDSVVIDDEARSWYRGVIGERRVASVLDKLGDGFTVLHSVPVGRFSTDIDHVVIGPAGVFTINTKYSPGKPVWVAGRGMYVDGHKQPYVLSSLQEARRASELLSRASGLTVPVIGVIAFVEPDRISVKARPGGDDGDPEIRVVDSNDLTRALYGRAIFSAEQTARIEDAATHPATWHQSPTPSTLGAHITREFEALEAAVGPRLAEPVGRAAAPVRMPRASASRGRSGRASAPPTYRSRSRRRPTESALEKLLRGLVVPAAILIIGIAILNSIASK